MREGGTMRVLGTDHVIWGPIRGLKNSIQWRKKNRQTDITTLKLNQPSGPIQGRKRPPNMARYRLNTTMYLFKRDRKALTSEYI